MKSRQFIAGATLAVASLVHAAESPAPSAVPQAASQQLLDHLYQQVEKYDRNASAAPGLSSSSAAALGIADFISIRNQLRQLGPKAWPLAPRIATLLEKTEKNQYDFAWILMEITPSLSATDASVEESLNTYRKLSGAEKLAQLARLGKTRSAAVLPDIRRAATDDAGPTRLVAIIGLAYAGTSDPELAGRSLADALKDKEKYNRAAAANSLRLLGNGAAVAAPALVEYLKTRDNVYAASGALKTMPLAAIIPVKQELESILNDSRLNEVQKRGVADLLIRIETEVPRTGI